MSWDLGVLLLSPGCRNATQISRAKTNFFHRFLRRWWLRSHIRLKTQKRISRWGDERRTIYLLMPFTQLCCIMVQESPQKAVDYVNEGAADSEWNGLLRVKSSHVPPAIQISGGWNTYVKNAVLWRTGAKGCPLRSLYNFTLTYISEFEGRWEHACWRVFWPVANLQLNYFAPDNQRVRLLRIMPTALMLCILPRTVTSEISVVEARILVTIYTKLLGFCSARCCKIFPKLYNEWT